VDTASVPDPAVLGRPPGAAAVDGVLDADVARTAGTAGFFASSSSSLDSARHSFVQASGYCNAYDTTRN